MADTTFQASLTRLNKAVVGRLANVQAMVDQYSVQGIFERPADSGLQGIVATDPALVILAAAAPRATQGSAVRIPRDGTVLRYQVREALPDGAGMLRLVLESTQ